MRTTTIVAIHVYNYQSIRMATMVQVHLLNHFPQYAPILAYWSYREWYTQRDIPFDVIIRSYIERAHSSTIPLAWVAIDEKKLPVGMVSLKNNDLWARTDL
ncbi:MAG TPA: hypothetical protein PLV62_03750, partial [Spirochaetota bacterium]|nr:hypothetical protein [Spirochaetota bacterium]